MEKKRIIIADDEPNICHLVMHYLEAKGYQVFTANDGKQALAEIRERKPDLVILDIMMPEMDGPGVAAAMKDHADTQKIPIIFLTSLIRKEDWQAADLNEYHFVAKPFEREDLLAVVNKVFEASTK